MPFFLFRRPAGVLLCVRSSFLLSLRLSGLSSASPCFLILPLFKSVEFWGLSVISESIWYFLMTGLGLWISGKITADVKPFSWLHIREHMVSLWPIYYRGIDVATGQFCYVLSKDQLLGLLMLQHLCESVMTIREQTLSCRSHANGRPEPPEQVAPKAQLENVLWTCSPHGGLLRSALQSEPWVGRTERVERECWFCVFLPSENPRDWGSS